MTVQEKDKYDLMMKAVDAILEGDIEKVRAISKDYVISPEAALKTFRMMGKERLLATKLNLSAANEAFGEGWMDEEERKRR